MSTWATILTGRPRYPAGGAGRPAQAAVLGDGEKDPQIVPLHAPSLANALPPAAVRVGHAVPKVRAQVVRTLRMSDG